MKRVLFPSLIVLISCSADKDTESVKSISKIDNNSEHIVVLKTKEKNNSSITSPIKKLDFQPSLAKNIIIIENSSSTDEERVKAINNIKSFSDNNSDALFYLGNLYEKGHWLEQSESKARDYYNQAANTDSHVLSHYSLALMLIDGRGGKVNLEKAEHLLKVNHNKNHAPSTYSLGYLYFISDNFEKCIDVFSVKDFNANEYSNYLLAISLLKTDQDIQRALTLLNTSAEKEHGYSHLTLGKIYQYGLYGKEIDVKKGYFHLNKAAEQNIPKANYELMLLSIEYPDIIDTDTNNIIKQLEKEDKNGNLDASFQLAKIYDQGRISKQDYKKALFWYHKSAKNGNNLAMYNLASMYANGDGAEESLDKAEHWLKESAKYGNKKAIELLENLPE